LIKDRETCPFLFNATIDSDSSNPTLWIQSATHQFPMITSTQNSKIKLVRQLLSQTKTRKKQQAFVLEGIRLLEEAFNTPFTPELVLYTEELELRGRTLIKEFKTRGVSCELTTPEVFRSTSDTENPQGILAIYPIISLPLPDRADFLIIADEIRDPGNLGTLLRTALAAGAEGVLLTPGTVDPFSPKVVRAGMGAHFHLPVISVSWEDIKKTTSELTLYLADMNEGSSIWQTDLTIPLGMIIGGEAHGPGKNARGLADKVLHIPMNGKSESINAAAAGAVLMYEIRRQRTVDANIEPSLK
jgi:TrmH family RNA methyltransferase